jgi:hypothetical protein
MARLAWAAFYPHVAKDEGETGAAFATVAWVRQKHVLAYLTRVGQHNRPPFTVDTLIGLQADEGLDAIDVDSGNIISKTRPPVVFVYAGKIVWW